MNAQSIDARPLTDGNMKTQHMARPQKFSSCTTGMDMNAQHETGQAA